MSAFVAYLVLFVVVGFVFVFFHLVLGRLIRPAKPNPEKLSIYECGEPAIGSSWVQFDLRFYVVALLFVIFDVEVAFFFPWAVVFGKLNALADTRLTPSERAAITQALDPNAAGNVTVAEEEVATQAQSANHLAWIAFGDILFFFGVLIVGFAYLWRRGDLDWVRSTAAERAQQELTAAAPPQEVIRPELVEVVAHH